MTSKSALVHFIVYSAVLQKYKAKPKVFLPVLFCAYKDL